MISTFYLISTIKFCAFSEEWSWTVEQNAYCNSRKQEKSCLWEGIY